MRLALLTGDKLLRHVQRAEAELDARLAASSDPAQTWVDSLRGAAMVVTRAGQVVAYNAAAAASFDLSADSSITALGLAPEDEAELMTRIASLRAGNGAGLLRLRRIAQRGPLLARLVADVAGAPDLLGVETTLVPWPARANAVLQQTFGLTPTEAAVLEALVKGQSVKDIAQSSGRSEATLRSHVRALLTKTETGTLIELVRMTLGLVATLDVGTRAVDASPYVSPAGNTFHTLPLPDGRKLDYMLIGAERGQPFMLIASVLGVSRLPESAERELERRGLRMVVPVRAGYGRSTPAPRDRHVHDVAIGDMRALLDHLGIGCVPVVAFVDEFQIAVKAAVAQPERFVAVMGCGVQFPLFKPNHFKHMSKWARFGLAQARYAPQAFPFVAQALFAIARSLGKRKCLSMVLSGSKPDLAVLDDPEFIAAMERGAEIVVTKGFSAHKAWIAEAAVGLGVDWSDALERCAVPITVFAGHEDPFVPFALVKQYVAEYPKITLRDYPGVGALYRPYLPDLINTIESACKVARS